MVNYPSYVHITYIAELLTLFCDSQQGLQECYFQKKKKKRISNAKNNLEIP